MSTTGAEIDVRGLRHAYPTRTGPLEVLAGVDLAVPAGSYCALQGPSGVGKSTLLGILGGLISPQVGAVRIDQADLSALGSDAAAAYRCKTVGFVFQHFGLLDTLTASENVELAAALGGIDREHRKGRAAELLGAVGLADRRDHIPATLSGGERQRVAIARALVNRPKLLLADEPTGNLDPLSTRDVVLLLEGLQRDWGYTMVMVTHNGAIARRAAQHLRLSHKGLAAA